MDMKAVLLQADFAMELKGKMICGIAGIFLFDSMGVPFGGALGFLAGSMLGHYFWDLPRERSEAESEQRGFQKRQGEFLFHTFRLCAKIAKSDGPVNRQELSHVEYIMHNTFRLNDRGRETAVKIWKQAKDSTEPFDNYARAFFNDFGKERHHVTNMLDLLFSMAAADGGLHPREEELLLRAAGTFHISRTQYERIKGRYYQGRTHQQARPSWNALDPHYAILGAKSSDSLDDIKKKYRALAMEWHPDRLAGKGMSDAALRHGKEKFQQITEAYDRILETRKS
jgi:DnaJ like chaperone protein